MVRTPGWRRWTNWPASPSWPSYAYLPSARADLLRRLGRGDEARIAYRAALALTDNAVEREFLRARLGDLDD